METLEGGSVLDNGELLTSALLSAEGQAVLILASARMYLEDPAGFPAGYSTVAKFYAEQEANSRIEATATLKLAALHAEDIGLERSLQHAIRYIEDPVNYAANTRVSFTESFFASNQVYVAPRIVIQLGMLGRSDGTLSKVETRLVDDDAVMVDCCTGNHEHEEGTDPDCNCKTLDCGCAFDPDSNSGDKYECRSCGDCEECCDSCSSCGDCGDRVKTDDDYCTVCDQCTDCCRKDGECWTCSGCDRRRSSSDHSQCGNCERCDRCCECFYCQGCDSSYSHYDRRYCGSCNCCGECCGCESDEDEDEESGPSIVTLNDSRELQFFDSARTQFKRNSLRRHISAEIEVDRASNASGDKRPLATAINKWEDAVVEDGSLSGSAAHETNTMPTNGDRFLEHIKDLTSGYELVGAGCSSSCGLHIHVNCKDMGMYDLRRVLMLYAKVERAMFELVDADRRSGGYADVCGNEYLNMSANPRTFRRQVLGTLYNEGNLMPKKGDRAVKGKKRDKHGSQGNTRYRALNVHSFFMRGSIEFRHHEGSVNYDEITNWALVCGNVIDTAVRWSEAKLKALPDDPFAALLAVIPASLHKYCEGKWAAHPVQAPNADGISQMRYGRKTDDGFWSQRAKYTGSLPDAPDYRPAKQDVVIPVPDICMCGDPNCTTRP